MNLRQINFSMKSKRIDRERRIDSLSIEVKGPFGIKVARFLCSPEGYQLHDILHGETIHGATDARARGRRVRRRCFIGATT